MARINTAMGLCPYNNYRPCNKKGCPYYTADPNSGVYICTRLETDTNARVYHSRPH